MNKKLIKKLAQASYKNNTLDKKSVERITPLLLRKDLKQYIKMLKNREQKKTVVVTVTSKKRLYKSEFAKLYPNKRIVHEIDPSLIAGIKILDNDVLFEMNLKNSLERIAWEASE